MAFEQVKLFNNNTGSIEEKYNKWMQENHGKIQVIDRRLTSRGPYYDVIAVFYYIEE